MRGLLVLVFVAVTLSGCLAGDDPPLNVDNGLGAAGLWGLVCADEAPADAVDPATGQVRDLCNVAAATGPKPVNEPSIAVNPTNPLNLIAGGNDYNGAMDVWTGVYASQDGGKTWTVGMIPGYPGGPVSPLTGYTAAGDAAIAFAPDGTAYYAGIAFHRAGVSNSVGRLASAGVAASDGPALFIARSSDGGVTWDHIAVPQIGVGPSVSVSNPAQNIGASAVPVFNDKEYIAVGPDGAVYVTWTRFRFVGPVYEAPIGIIKSTDRGETWSEPQMISRATGNQGSIPVVAPDGTVHVTWGEFVEQGQMNVVVRSSSDGGATWGEIQKVANITPIEPSHRTRVNSFPHLTVDPAGSPNAGRLSIVWAANETGDADVYMSQSTDGVAWSTPVRLNQDMEGNGRAQFFPWAVATPDGVVHVVYFDARDDPRNEHLAVYMAQTVDGSSVREFPVTDAPFLADADGFTNANFLGDYLGITGDASGVYPIWPDTRPAQDELGDLDLYIARLAASV